jgi:hypothetical protein
MPQLFKTTVGFDKHAQQPDREEAMQVLLNSETRSDGIQPTSDHLESVVAEVLGHYGARIARVEAHLTDTSGAVKAGLDEVHCTLQAHPVGREPVVVKDRARTAHQAMHSALLKLVRALANGT